MTFNLLAQNYETSENSPHFISLIQIFSVLETQKGKRFETSIKTLISLKIYKIFAKNSKDFFVKCYFLQLNCSILLKFYFLLIKYAHYTKFVIMSVFNKNNENIYSSLKKKHLIV